MNGACSNKAVGVLVLALLLTVVVFPSPLRAQEGKIQFHNVPQGWEGPVMDIIGGRTWWCVYGKEERRTPGDASRNTPPGGIMATGRINASLCGPLTAEQMQQALVQKAEEASRATPGGVVFTPPQAIVIGQGQLSGYITTMGPTLGSTNYGGRAPDSHSYSYIGACFVTNGQVGVEFSISAGGSASAWDFSAANLKEKGDAFRSAVDALLKGVTVGGGPAAAPQPIAGTPATGDAPAGFSMAGTWTIDFNGWGGEMTLESQDGSHFTGTQQTYKIIDGRVNGTTVSFTRPYPGGHQDYTGTLTINPDGSAAMSGTFTQDDGTGQSPWKAQRAK